MGALMGQHARHNSRIRFLCEVVLPYAETRLATVANRIAQPFSLAFVPEQGTSFLADILFTPALKILRAAPSLAGEDRVDLVDRWNENQKANRVNP
jgi:hypothetical protein